MTNLETEPAPLPPPNPTTIQPAMRRWSRSDDRVVFGVAGGLGRALAIDPLLVRIAFVVLALFSGIGVVFYLAALAMLADSPAADAPSAIRRVGGAIAAVLATIWVFNGHASLPGAGWVVALGLFGAAVALWRGRSPVDPTSIPGEVGPPTSADPPSTTDRWNSWTKQRQQRPRPPRSVLGLLTAGAATMVGATVWLAEGDTVNRGTLTFGWVTVVIGVGLLVGSVVGRARWLIVPAVGTLAAAVAASAVGFAGVAITARGGDRSEFIQPGSSVAEAYRTGVGSFELSLADYPGNASTAVEVGIGDLRVVVPDNARVHIDAAAGIGSIDALGSSRNGYRRTLSVDSAGAGPSIDLRLRVGIGAIEVRRASFPFADGPVAVPSPVTILPTVADVPALQFFGDGTVLFADGSIAFGDGGRIEADGTSQIPIVEQRPDGSVQLDNGAVIRADRTVVSPGGFVIPHPKEPSPPPVSTVVATPTSVGITSVTTTTEVQP